jgi:hypothetical protein
MLSDKMIRLLSEMSFAISRVGALLQHVPDAMAGDVDIVRDVVTTSLASETAGSAVANPLFRCRSV